jgi:hypothetical protein
MGLIGMCAFNLTSPGLLDHLFDQVARLLHATLSSYPVTDKSRISIKSLCVQCG